ncbi:PTPLA-domain-containing protein [Delitschia confertaspora ATCC 74209]|uniref:Very-long-chain (3R)-3-hydroxyacyl-CoA dehydratase n=1 Tax=Delitschia confertaspora ATCC 74209 TaxID=1513339 RepID=A0A9P4N3D9_9PLEO|nr:PTPLA-domain-containing protein [Delitschia confertaspora ATCC 74209]
MAPKTTTASTSRSQLPRQSSSPIKNSYLLAYNALSAVLWAMVLMRTVRDGMLEGQNKGWFGQRGGYFGFLQGSQDVYARNEEFVRWTQSLAGMEVLHSLFGVVRAPLITTLMQVSSRFLLVHLIASPFPSTTAPSPAYTTMLLAWSITEVVRYSYFVFTLSGMGVPRVWQWLRYNTFLVLYPMGVASECWLVWRASTVVEGRLNGQGPSGKLGSMLKGGMWGILGVYVPGFYILFTHMLKQRRRIMKGKGRAE